jgi:hypothetical protein
MALLYLDSGILDELALFRNSPNGKAPLRAGLSTERMLRSFTAMPWLRQFSALCAHVALHQAAVAPIVPPCVGEIMVKRVQSGITLLLLIM